MIRIRMLKGGHLITLTPIAAVAVASLRFEFIDVRLHLDYRARCSFESATDGRQGADRAWLLQEVQPS